MMRLNKHLMRSKYYIALFISFIYVYDEERYVIYSYYYLCEVT